MVYERRWCNKYNEKISFKNADGYKNLSQYKRWIIKLLIIKETEKEYSTEQSNVIKITKKYCQRTQEINTEFSNEEKEIKRE